MPIYKSYLDKVVASTHKDLQGEKYTKEFFEDLIRDLPPRWPVNQTHDMSQRTLGYFENFRLVPDEKNLGEWHLIANVHITSDNIDEALKEFSFSARQTIKRNSEHPEYAIYLPYPQYNNEDLINDFIESEPNLLVGRCIRKSLTPEQVGLIVAGFFFILGPEWDIQYKKNVRPILERLLEIIHKLKVNEISADVVLSIKGIRGEEVDIYFIPDRADEIGSLEEEKIKYGLCLIEAFLGKESKAKTTGVKRIKLLFDKDSSKYKLFHVQYRDGTDEHFT